MPPSGDVTISDLRALLESPKTTSLDPSSKLVVRHERSDRYVSATTTENGRLVFATSSVDMWRSDRERAELVERIIEQDRTIHYLRLALRDIAEEGAGSVIAGLHAHIAQLMKGAA